MAFRHGEIRNLLFAFIVAGSCGWTGRPTDFPAVANVIWSQPLPSFGPPAVDDGAVYFALRDHRIASYDRVTGAPLWSRSTGVSGSNLGTHDTPAHAGKLVIFGDENLFGIDASTGELRWTFSAADGDYNPRVGAYAFKTDSVRVYAGSVVGSLFAIDAQTGSEIWRAPLLEGQDRQVRVVAVKNGRIYAHVRYDGPAYSGRVYALNAVDGTVAWSYELPKSPGLLNGTRDAVFASSSSSTLLIVSFDDGRIAALRTNDGTPAWMVPRLPSVTTQNDNRRLTASGGVLVATSAGPDLIAGYDLENGIELWRSGSDQGSASSVLSSDGTLAYIRFGSGNLAAYNLRTGRRDWVWRAPSGTFYGAPVSSGDTLFMAGSAALYAIVR